MKRGKLIRIYVFAFLSLVHLYTRAETVSPFNKKIIADASADFTFIVSGHFHGSSCNISTFPAATLLSNIDTLNALHSSFMVSLGDLFLDVKDEDLIHYQKTLFDKLQMPLFNAVGNHDLSNGNRYEKEFGKSFYFFTKQQALFIVLNTELEDGNIKGEQLNVFKAALSKVQTSNVKNVFVFSHRPVWAEGDPNYAPLFKENTRSKFGIPNFKNELQPLLQQLKLPVYWMSGSMGSGPASFFYDKNKTTGITFMQTAIRDTPRDAVLLVTIKNGTVYFKGLSLTGAVVDAIENYNVNYWQQNVAPEKKFNYRLLPYLTWLMLTHHYFWTGFVIAIALILCINALIKKWRRKK